MRLQRPARRLHALPAILGTAAARSANGLAPPRARAVACLVPRVAVIMAVVAVAKTRPIAFHPRNTAAAISGALIVGNVAATLAVLRGKSRAPAHVGPESVAMAPNVAQVIFAAAAPGQCVVSVSAAAAHSAVAPFLGGIAVRIRRATLRAKNVVETDLALSVLMKRLAAVMVAAMPAYSVTMAPA